MELCIGLRSAAPFAALGKREEMVSIPARSAERASRIRTRGEAFIANHRCQQTSPGGNASTDLAQGEANPGEEGGEVKGGEPLHPTPESRVGQDLGSEGANTVGKDTGRRHRPFLPTERSLRHTAESTLTRHHTSLGNTVRSYNPKSSDQHETGMSAVGLGLDRAAMAWREWYREPWCAVVECDSSVIGRPSHGFIKSQWLVECWTPICQSAWFELPADGHGAGNAARYSTVGSPIVVSGETASNGVSIAVRDEGPGLAPEDAKRVFERFYRVNKSRSRGSHPIHLGGGSGLGLSIVQALVQQSKGEIRFDTGPQQGTTVAITLPGLKGTSLVGVG
jgi:Histidine kinase-, DNA gyrase B-, and HSP90-like ATPase